MKIFQANMFAHLPLIWSRRIFSGDQFFRQKNGPKFEGKVPNLVPNETESVRGNDVKKKRNKFSLREKEKKVLSPFFRQ